MPRMGRPGRGLALALWCHYAAEAQSPTQAPTFTTWRPTVAGASSPATTPAPSPRPTTPAPTTARPTNTAAPTCVALASTAAADAIDCLPRGVPRPPRALDGRRGHGRRALHEPRRAEL